MPYLTNPSREDKRKQANKQKQRILMWSSSANSSQSRGHYLDGLYFIQVRHVAHKYEAIGNYSTEVTLEC